MMDFETWLQVEGQRRASQGLPPLAPLGDAWAPASDQGPTFDDVLQRADALEAAGVVSYAVAGLDASYDAAAALLADTVRVARSYVERAALVRQEAANDAAAKRTADLARARWQAARDQADRLGTNGHGLGAKPAEAPKPKRTPEQVLQALHGLHGEASALLDEADAQGQAAAVQAAALSARPLWVKDAEERAATAAAAVDVTAPLPDLRAQCAAWQAAMAEWTRISGEPHRGDEVAQLERWPDIETRAAAPELDWLRGLQATAAEVRAARRQQSKEAYYLETAWAYGAIVTGLGQMLTVPDPTPQDPGRKWPAGSYEAARISPATVDMRLPGNTPWPEVERRLAEMHAIQCGQLKRPTWEG